MEELNIDLLLIKFGGYELLAFSLIFAGVESAPS